MHSIQRLIRDFKARPIAHAAAAFVLATSQFAFTAFADAPAVHAGTIQASNIQCSAAVDGTPEQCAGSADSPQLALPHGSVLCSNSGPAAACTGSDSALGTLPGTPSVPSGQAACPNNSSLSSSLSTPAACSNTVLGPNSSPDSAARGSSAAVLPSVPTASLMPSGTPSRLALDADATVVPSGGNAVLTATTTGIVSAGTVIEIFDLSANTLAGACSQASQCIVAYAARGGAHTFSAYITAPTAQIPPQESSVSSNQVTVGWLASTLAANNTVVGPGHPVTFTATSTVDVGKVGRWLEIYDLTSKTRLTYCSRGTTCATTVAEPAGGTHEIVGYITGKPEAVSAPIYVTWLTVTLAASTTSSTGGAVYLRASANADLTTTPWVIGIFDDHGRLVEHACKAGRSCSVQAWVVGATPYYTAEIGALPPATTPTPLSRLLQDIAPTGLADVQARSAAVRPTRLLWGVDSCKAFTDSYWGTSGLLPQIVSQYGKPDFWGRYLTNTVCPGISANEIHAAAYYGMGILPIYNDYNCSAVVGYANGHSYADAAVQTAEGLGIPPDHALAIDIEPASSDCPGAANIDTGFIEGWYDGVYGAGYVPAYYGNGTNGSEFANAWCTTVAILPNIARDSYLWSFEPSLIGSFTRASAPGYAAYNPGCAGTTAAWQYQIGSYSANPNIDSDEAMSQIPIWYPGL